jgi:hypothetical protein
MRSKQATAAAALLVFVLAAAALVSLSAGAGAARAAPRGFFGIAPQTVPTEADVEYMRAGRIGSLRWALTWDSVQTAPEGAYDWGGFDQIVALAARQRVRLLPVLGGIPRWLSHNRTRLPIDSARARNGWAAFVRAAAERYGPHGDFWREHGPGSADFVPKLPAREWQIWNEANFFYFTRPASPTRYARLVKISKRAIGRAEPRATVILAGLFGEPSARPPKAVHAVDFLDRLYRVPGIKAAFDGVALHPYAESAGDVERMTEELRAVTVRNHDRRARLYITEMGWGSQNRPNQVSFEQGVGFQLREMRSVYRYLTQNRGRLNLAGVYWFTWKDIRGSCNFCDSTGLFREGERLKPKPAWHAFVQLTGGRARP